MNAMKESEVTTDSTPFLSTRPIKYGSFTKLKKPFQSAGTKTSEKAISYFMNSKFFTAKTFSRGLAFFKNLETIYHFILFP